MQQREDEVNEAIGCVKDRTEVSQVVANGIPLA